MINKSIAYDWGTRLLINLPYGLSSETVIKHARTISEGLRKDIDIYYSRGLIIDVYEKDMPVSVAFPREERRDYRVPIGVNRRGEPVFYDFTGSFPHLLIGGISGGGKSVLLRAILTSLSLGPQPYLMLNDLKGGVELGLFRDLAHVIGFATTLQEVDVLIAKAVREMERRYGVMAAQGIQEWPGKPLIVVMDELADLKVRAKDDQAVLKNGIKAKLSTISAKGRAARVILVLATQRPSADIIDGLIKTNVATSLCFRTRDAVQSRIVLDHDGAAALPEVPGRCIFQQARDETIQTFYLSYEEARERLKDVPRRERDERKPEEGGALDGNSIVLG
ncbi:MAG TPA: FtsK/SpoIIIE domain-containing protein [Brevibacillus sp.]|nr:FtsK/SpoIIIE domain-containing protein [Brevibacillus sp.]